MKSSDLTTLILLGFLVSWSSVAFGQADVVSLQNSTRQTVITTTELSNVKPFKNPLLPPDTSRAFAETASSAAGRLVSGWFRGGGAAASTGTPGSRAFGTFGIPYSSGRAQLGQTNQDFYDVGRSSFLTTTYPYRTVGKLTFSAGYCSASVILPGIILTAAHCVQDFGSGNTVFSNFQFTPASDTRSGSRVPAPYGTWTWHTLTRSSSWSDGTDVGCGVARDNDLAIIALNRNGSNRLVGELTGWLGYGWNNYSFVSDAKTGNLLVAATTTLGYPFLFDGGRIMQQARGPSYLTTVCSAGQVMQGSNFTPGSSGGPWVVNFRASNPVYSGGASAGTQTGRSVAVGVSSWIEDATNTTKGIYSSQFRQNTAFPNADYGGYGAGNIGALVEGLCSQPANDGSGQTLGQRGWCG